MKTKVRVCMVGAGSMASGMHYRTLASFDDVEVKPFFGPKGKTRLIEMEVPIPRVTIEVIEVVPVMSKKLPSAPSVKAAADATSAPLLSFICCELASKGPPSCGVVSSRTFCKTSTPSTACSKN